MLGRFYEINSKNSNDVTADLISSKSIRRIVSDIHFMTKFVLLRNKDNL